MAHTILNIINIPIYEINAYGQCYQPNSKY